MGQFSFMYSYTDSNTKYLNLHEGDVAKMLIPKEFVGSLPEFKKGYVEGIYDSYGDLCILNDNGYGCSVKYDMYTILALINNENMINDFMSLPTCNDDLNDSLRINGIMNFDSCSYPLKIVPSHIDITYEDVLKSSDQD